MTAAIFKPMDTTHAVYIGTIHKGPGLFSKIGEVPSVPSYTAKVGNKWSIAIAAFSEGIDISKDLFDDDIHGEWMAQVSEFGIMARYTQDFNAFRIFRGAFTTTLTADGVSLVNTAHPLLGGSTTSNRVTAALVGAATSVLTTTSLNSGMRLLAEMKSQANVPLGCVGDTIVVPPALFVTARQVTGSALVAENGNNAVNVLSMDYGVAVYQSVWMGSASPDGLGSDSAWFLLDSKRHSIMRFVRQELQTFLRPWGMSNNRTYNYQANFREEVYCPDYIGVVGSSGDAT